MRVAIVTGLAVAALAGVCSKALAAVVSFEAESGALGADFTNGISGSIQFISIATTNVNGGNPGSTNRVATYTVNFPASGKYYLYARVRVGPDTFNDDSLFYADSFGVKSATSDSDWVTVNGLAAAGFSNSTEVVTGGGTLGSGIWKWISLSQAAGQTRFSVSAPGNRTFQIGARETGLDIDKFAFGTAGYSFTVSNLDNGTDGTPPPSPPPSSSTINPNNMYQTVEGLGGAIAFYNGWVTAHPYKNEIYTNAFAGLNLSMLRLGNWFRYQGTANFDPDAPEFVSRANQVLGRPVPVLISSWAPPAFLKSNGQVGNGGTLLYTNGGFLYSEFAQYWFDSIVAYRNLSVSPTWISIQNEPDWEAGYDSCVFRPNQVYTNPTNYWAGYSNALSATYLRLTNLSLPPKLLGPENVGLNGNSAAVQNYATTMNPNHFYGVAHHLYGGSTDGTPDGYNPALSTLTNIFPSKPRFMTEYGLSDMIDQANLIHNVLTVEQASAYNYWSLIWPGTEGGLIQIEFPWNQSQWTNAPPGTPTQSHGWWLTPAYWAMKHFSYFVQPGYRRVAASCTDTNVLTSAYLSPEGLRLVVVLINRNLNAATNSINYGSFSYFNSAVYQTASTNNFQFLGAAAPQLILPAESLTTVVLDKFVAVGAATNPSPTNDATEIGLTPTLGWSPGNNALVHAVYIGVGSNALQTATPAAPEFKGFFTNSSFAATGLFGSTKYHWRVDEIAGANTNTGAIWSFSTVPLPALVHRYSFSETGGTTVADSEGGTAWNGVVFNSGVLAGGQLTLASTSSQYANLPSGIVSTLTNFTIEAWVRLNSAAGWARIFDFGNTTTTYMFLTPTNGSSNGKLRFAITTNSAGGEQQITGTAALTTGVWHHVVVTRNGNTGILYQNGVAVGTNASMTLRPANLGSTINNYLGRSQWPDPYLNGLLDEFRIYSVPLSAAEIAATYALGPNQLLSIESPTLSFVTTPPTLTLAWPLASAGYTVQSRTNLALGNWLNVTSPVPQIIGGQWQVVLPVSASIGSTYYRLAK